MASVDSTMRSIQLPVASALPRLATVQPTWISAPDSAVAGTTSAATDRSAYRRGAAEKLPAALLLASAVPAALVSNSTPAPLMALSAVTVMSKLPAPSAPSGSVKLNERARASPGASAAAAAPLNATAVLTTTVPGVPSALRWRITTRSWKAAGVATAPVLTSSHCKVTVSPACTAVCCSCTLRVCRSGPTSNARSMALSVSSGPAALNSGTSPRASTTTRRRYWPMALSPAGQLKLALRAAWPPAAMAWAVKAWAMLATTTPVLRFSSSSRSVHWPLAEAVPVLRMAQVTVTAWPAVHSPSGVIVRSATCRLA